MSTPEAEPIRAGGLVAPAPHRERTCWCSGGGHLAGLAALAPSNDDRDTVDFVVMGYAITSMETETYRPSRVILLGEHATPQLRRETSLDALVTPSAPPFFIWHTAEDSYVPPEHTYRFARALAANDVAHAVHVFAHGPHSLGLARRAGDAETWTTLAASWIAERIAPIVAHAPVRNASTSAANSVWCWNRKPCAASG